ncbi:MAG: VCBS repeat-containing protein [Chitinophagales bacterium]|nr:VCBS repeat-containing protein [Chitinophagales bacterium]
MCISKNFIISFCFLLLSFSLTAKEESFQGLDLWEQVQIDTFPFLKTHEAIDKLVNVSLMSIYLADKMNKEQGKNMNTKDMYAQAYYYSLLAKRYNLCDSIIASLDKKDTVYTNLLGHTALRYYIPCLESDTKECDSIKWNVVLPLLKEAAQKSNLMPKGQWQYLYDYLSGNLKQKQSAIRLQFVDDSLQAISPNTWEGGVLKFSISPDEQNLLLSDGERKQIKVLQLNKNNKWEDITISTGLNGMPGGYNLNAVDYNNDGWDDIFIMRKKSDRRSRAEYYPSLLRNNKNGTFTDVSKELGLDAVSNQSCACWDDINGDGKLDVYVGSQYSGSKWMVQNDSGRFVNQSFSYNLLTRKKNVADCFISDFNNDGKKDIFLSLVQDSNMVFQHDRIRGQYDIFKNITSLYDVKTPRMSNKIIPFDYDLSGQDRFILQADYFTYYETVAEILNQNEISDTKASRTYLFQLTTDSTYKEELEPTVGLMRAGVIVQSPDGSYLIGGGGQNTESIYPAFIYKYSSQGQTLEVMTPDNWPTYIHSATVYADSLNQPVIVFRGGGNYPLMTNHLSSYKIKMPEQGTFVKVFNAQKVQLGSQVKMTYTAPNGKQSDLVIIVRTPDSKGYNAMQEWVWVPEGGRLSDIHLEEKNYLKK